jgi:gliding motility-associated-like protein
VEDSVVNLSAGTYSVTVSDANSCTKISVFSLSEPQPFSVVATELKPVSCFGGNDGMALVKTTNGIAPFAFLWNNNWRADTARGLSAANYSVTVTDAASCSATATIAITQPTPLQITTTKKDVRCFNESSGEIQCLVSGGVIPYSFAWSNGQITRVASNLPAGNYSVTVTDQNGCTITSSETIYQPDSLALNLMAVSESCFGSSDGKIIAFSNGGIPNYTLSYASGSGVFQSVLGDTIYNLIPDLYNVELKDANGCITSKSIRVNSPIADRFDYIAEKTSCFGAQYKDGNVAIIVLEPQNAPYNFTLLGSYISNTTGFFKNLGAGIYNVNITNKHGCDTVITVYVPEPEDAVLEVFPKDTVVETGQPITLQVNLIPYTNQAIKHYMWSPQQGLSCVDCPSPVFVSYDDRTEIDVTVVYNNGCQASAKAVIETELHPSLFAPNMFSPNRDGINDKFFVYANKVKDFKLNIYNRWGEKVFTTESLTEGWDGYYKDIPQEPGVYVYVVEITFLNHQKITQSGSVTLVR